MRSWLALVLAALSLLVAACAPPRVLSGVYHWKTTLDWTEADTARLRQEGGARLGLRLFDWGRQGPEGSLVVRRALPAAVEVVPVVYVTLAHLQDWVRQARFDPDAEAQRLWAALNGVLATAWPGRPAEVQLDADWAGSTRSRWFALLTSLRPLAHAAGARLVVTVRLHQVRDRATQGVPPADAGVVMLYGAGDKILDPDLVQAYLAGGAYPLPLEPAFPTYSQALQYNGYGRLVALHRLDPAQVWPAEALAEEGPNRFVVLRRAELAGRPLLAHDRLVVDRVSAGDLETAAALPSVRALLGLSSGRLWLFDDDPGAWPQAVLFLHP